MISTVVVWFLLVAWGIHGKAHNAHRQTLFASNIPSLFDTLPEQNLYYQQQFQEPIQPEHVQPSNLQTYQQPNQQSYQPPYQRPYQPPYQQGYYEPVASNVRDQLGKLVTLDPLVPSQHDQHFTKPRQLNDSIPNNKRDNSDNREDHSSVAPTIGPLNRAVGKAMAKIRKDNDPINEWVEKDPNDTIFETILQKVMTRKRHFNGTMKKLLSVSTNLQNDMALFKMSFMYVKPNATKTTKCDTTFNVRETKVFLGRMECVKEQPVTLKTSGDAMWTEEDPEDHQWMLPLTIAVKTVRTDLEPHHMVHVSKKEMEEKTMYKIAFLVEKIKHPKLISCVTWFSVHPEGPLRHVDVHTFACDDALESNGNSTKKGLQSKSHKADIRKLGIAKIMVFDIPEREPYLLPKEYDGEDLIKSNIQDDAIMSIEEDEELTWVPRN